MTDHAGPQPRGRAASRSWEMFLLALLVLFPSTAARANHDLVSPETLSTITGMLRRTESLSETTGCRQEDLSVESGDQCGFLAECATLSANKDRDYIYTNSKGERAPNYKLRSLRREMGACANAVEEKLQRGKGPSPRADDARIRREAELEFYRSIAANHEQHKLGRILQASAELALEANAESEPKQNNVAETVAVIERRAGESLSDRSRAFYIRYLGLMGADTPEQPKSEPHDTPASRTTPESRRLGAKGIAAFKKAQNGVIRILEHRRNRSNSVEIDNMIDRVSAVLPKFEKSIAEGGRCSGPDAYFSGSEGHTVVICPDFLGLPETSLIEVLSHEIGHSIDPCLASGPFFKLAGSDAGYLTILPTQDLEGGKPRTLATLMHIGIPLKQNPFYSVVSCLASPASVHARITSEREIQEMRDQISAFRDQLLKLGRPRNDQDILDADRALEEIRRDWTQHSSCASLPVAAKTQIQESFSDWIASEVLNAEVASAPPALKRETAFEATLSFTSMGCESFQPRLSSEFEDFVKKTPACGARSGDRTTTEALVEVARKVVLNSHPSSSARVDRIFFAQPEIRKALGCPVRQREVRKCE